MDIQILRMSEEDLDKVVELGWSSEDVNPGTNCPAFFDRETLQSWIQDPNGIALVAKVDGEFAGFCLASYIPHSKDVYGNDMVVVEKFQRLGIGTKFTEEQCRIGLDLGANHIYALVKVNNKKMLNLKTKLGFEIGDQFYYVEKMI